MKRQSRRLFILLAALVVVVAACSGAAIEDDSLDGVAGGSGTTQIDLEGADRLLEVELSEFDITAPSFDFVPGETVKFVVTNAGVVAHELRLSNDDRVNEHVAGGHDGHDESDAVVDDDHDEDAAGDHEMEGMEEAQDVVLLLEGGETGTLLFTFPDNVEDYTLAVCLIPGLYEAGMTTDLSYGA